jgi:geranylgeranylglycerol-phosphate geranylgeranyltransferase
MPILLNTARLIRVLNCLLAAASVWLGAYMTWLTPDYLAPALASVAIFLLCAAGNIFNDLVDLESDRINHPGRILVTGQIGQRTALWISISAASLALLISIFVNLELFILIILMAAMLTIYNLRLKRLPMVGNLTIALLSGLTFIAGGMAIEPSYIGHLPGPLIPAAMAFLIHLTREIIKDAEDIEGDIVHGARTLPQIVGRSKAAMAALILFALFVIVTCLPVFLGWFGRAYQIIAIYVVDLPVLALMILIWGNPTQKMLKAGSLSLKFAMILGVIALALA